MSTLSPRDDRSVVASGLALRALRNPSIRSFGVTVDEAVDKTDEDLDTDKPATELVAAADVPGVEPRSWPRRSG